MGQGRRRTRWAGITAILTAALALTGCSGARWDFGQEFRGDPGIAAMELTTGDNMPFTDGVRAEVTLSHELTHEDTTALLTRIGAFIREHGDEPVTVSVTSPAGNITLPVFGDDAVTAAAAAAASDIATDPVVTKVTLSGPSQDGRITSVGIVIEPDPVTAFALARSAPEQLAELAGPGGAYVSVRDSGLAIRLEGAPGPWLDDTESSWARVNPSFPVTGVRGDKDRVTLILQNEADVPGAQAIVRAVTPPPTIPVTFGSPLVHLGQNGTGDEVRVMLAQLDAPTLALIRLVWTTDSRAVFRAANDADAAVLESALAQLPDDARGGLEVEVDVEQN